MIIMIFAATFLIIFDTGVVISDAQSDQFRKSNFIHAAYSFLEWVQAFIALITLMSYMVLFIWFVLLIRKEREKFGDLSNHIIAFFTVMLAVLLTNLILNLVFYFNFSPNVDDKLTPEQY